MEPSGPWKSGRKIVGVGLGRTGTNSLHQALTLLEIPTLHVPRDLGLRNLETGEAHFDALSEVDAIANGSCAPWREIDARFPGSFFILTLRGDRAAWLRSCERYEALQLEGWTNLADETRNAKLAIRRFQYGTEKFDADVWSKRYDSHVSDVLSHFRDRSDQLLCLDVSAGDGWEKLCPFLGLPVPEVPFPHKNSLRSASGWYKGLQAFWSEVTAAWEPGTALILVDGGEYNAVKSGKIFPFPEEGGVFTGYPENAEQLIENLERLRMAGAKLIAFTEDCAWILREYPAFGDHMTRLYKKLPSSDRCVLFDLG